MKRVRESQRTFRRIDNLGSDPSWFYMTGVSHSRKAGAGLAGEGMTVLHASQEEHLLWSWLNWGLTLSKGDLSDNYVYSWAFQPEHALSYLSLCL
jgi:hypothetical protein